MSFKTILKALKVTTQFEFCDTLGVGNLYTPEFFKKFFDYILPKKPVSAKAVKTLDYDEDFRLLWADFKAEYNIDLISDEINWWEFTSLFERLILLDNVSGTSKVIGYRSAKIPNKNKNNANQIDHLRNMKARYRLESVAEESVKRFVEGMKRRVKKNK